jgi:hypothetical protein
VKVESSKKAGYSLGYMVCGLLANSLQFRTQRTDL